MPISAFDPVDDNRTAQEYKSVDQQIAQLKKTVSLDTAQRINEIYKQSPFIPPSIILAMAKSGASSSTVDTVRRLSGQALVNNNDPDKPDSQGWFSRIVGNNVKAATRWSVAALNLVPELVQNAAAEAFSPNDPAGTDGWFRSTSLGTMIAAQQGATTTVVNPDGTKTTKPLDVGSGFFLGGTAAKNQAEKAREFRGTINGHAWTVGRGAAQLAFTPGSKAYNILSGFVDASVAILADPTGPLSSKIRNVGMVDELLPNILRTSASRTARAAIPGIADEATLLTVGKLARGEAGLTNAETAVFNQSKFGKWVQSNPGAQRVSQWVSSIAADTTKTVETKTRILLETIDGLSPEVAREFAQADTQEKVWGVLGQASARLANNPDDVLMPKDIRDIYGARPVQAWLDDTLGDRVPFFRAGRKSKLFAEMPDQQVIINGSGLDKTKTVKTAANYLRGVGIADNTDEFNSLMDGVVSAVSTANKGESRVAMKKAYDDMLKAVYKKAGGTSDDAESLVTSLRQKFEEQMTATREYTLNSAGIKDDGGWLQILLPHVNKDEVLRNFSPETWDRLILMGPGSLIEMADDVMYLPDFRELRALSGKMAFAKKSKIVDGVSTLTEYAQNNIWKPLTLMTGGYVMRNMIDAQTRMAMAGLGNLITDPLEAIMWITRRKGKFDILGNEFQSTIAKEVEAFPKAMEDFQEATNFGIWRHMDDPWNSQLSARATGNWTEVTRDAENMAAHTSGYIANLRQIFSDPVLNRVSRISLDSPNADEQLNAVKAWLRSDAGKDARDTIKKYIQTGIKIGDPESTAKGFVSLGDEIPDDVLDAWVDRLSTLKVNSLINNDRELKILAAYNRVPLMETSEGVTRFAPVEIVSGADIEPGDIRLTRPDGQPEIVRLVRPDGSEYEGVVLGTKGVGAETIDPFTGQTVAGETQYVVQPVHPGEALNDFGSANARNLIDYKGNIGGILADTIKKPEYGKIGSGDLSTKFEQTRKRMTDWFFRGLYGKATATLEKSPVFRQYYYREVMDTAELLAPDQARVLYDSIVERAAAEGMKPAQYVGSRDVLKKLKSVADNAASEATGTVESLDGYAKAVALNQTKDLLYNASSRSNLEDMLRVIVPFGSAWREVLSTYISAAIEDPARIRRAQLIFTGATKFDTDQDGQGFFYRDPVSGEYSFNFPASGWISKLVTGMETPMQAPVKRLSIGLGVIPSLGPVGQIAASQIIPDTPKFDDVVKVLLPYGRKTDLNIVPMWAKRMGEAWDANTSNLQSVYGNTYIETLRALSTSGEYDLSDFNDQEKLYADAKTKAQRITALRALGQFFGPTSPSPEFKIDTEAGDMYASQLVKEFQKLQADNYDTAVSEFLRIYGNDALLYLSNKTESLAGGLEATEQFGVWERQNGDLFNKYADVAGFMAPGGDNFSFEVWSRQLSSGKRRRLTDREIVELAQYRAASAQYRALRSQLPANPSSDQKAWLKSWRIELNKQYPGFPKVAEFNPGELPAKIDQLKRMVQEPSLQDNDVAVATRQYLEARDSAEQSAANAGVTLGTLRAAPLREWLMDYANTLKQETPEFARIYDRLLSQEIED